MSPQKIFKYCPKCTGKLVIDDKYILKCNKCGFNLYINPAPCNGVIIENNKGQIMLVKRKDDPKKGYWDLPGGFINPNESFAKSVKREIKEELNVEITLGKIIGVYADTYLFQDINIPTLGIVILAKLKSFNLKPSDDITSYKFFDKKDVLEQKLAFKSLKQGIGDYIKTKL